MRYAVVVFFLTTLICAGGWHRSEQRAARNLATYSNFKYRVIDNIPAKYLDNLTIGELE